MIEFTVHGTPAPQGSKRGFVVKGRAVLTESSKAVHPWREAVKWAALEARNGTAPIDGPVHVQIVFYLPRPISLSKRKAALGPCRKPDLDKLVRSTFDALSDAGVWTDDARVVGLSASKWYAGQVPAPDTPGALIVVRDSVTVAKSVEGAS